MKNANPIVRAAAALAAALALIAAQPACGEDLGRPRLLIASPAMQGFYSHAALLILPKRDHFVGFILNRSTEIHMANAFPDDPKSAQVAEAINFGGPEEAHQIYAVSRHNPGNPSKNIFGDLYITQGSEAVDRLLEEAPNEARYFAGYVQWEPGELEKEIQAGFWYVADADASVVMRRDTGSVWQDLVQKAGNGHPVPQNLQETRLELGTAPRS